MYFKEKKVKNQFMEFLQIVISIIFFGSKTQPYFLWRTASFHFCATYCNAISLLTDITT